MGSRTSAWGQEKSLNGVAQYRYTFYTFIHILSFLFCRFFFRFSLYGKT